MLKDIGLVYYEPIGIYCDNSSAIKIYKSLVLHSKTKHISIKFHFLGDKVNEKEVKLDYVPTKEQIADIFTKTFEYLRRKLGAISPLDQN